MEEKKIHTPNNAQLRVTGIVGEAVNISIASEKDVIPETTKEVLANIRKELADGGRANLTVAGTCSKAIASVGGIDFSTFAKPQPKIDPNRFFNCKKRGIEDKALVEQAQSLCTSILNEESYKNESDIKELTAELDPIFEQYKKTNSLTLEQKNTIQTNIGALKYYTDLVSNTL
jgi:hypothetical protein